MNLSPESVKKTLLNKVNELSASSWQYKKKLRILQEIVRFHSAMSCSLQSPCKNLHLKQNC